MTEDGVVGGDDHVGAKRELEATAEALALDGGDDRDREVLERVEQLDRRVDVVPDLLRRQLEPGADVTTEAEVLTLRPDQDCSDVMVAGDRSNRFAKAGEQLRAEAVLRRVVEDERGNAGGDAEFDSCPVGCAPSGGV
jgi:hypothetical protein